MSKTSAIMIGLSVIAIGLGVPAACIYAAIFYGFNNVVAAIVAISAMIVSCIIGVVGVVLGPLGHVFDEPSSAERERLRAMRAHQRAMLEELDDIISVLGEVRDTLKVAEE
jgi:uncharacterized membrane protein